MLIAVSQFELPHLVNTSYKYSTVLSPSERSFNSLIQILIFLRVFRIFHPLLQFIKLGRLPIFSDLSSTNVTVILIPFASSFTSEVDLSIESILDSMRESLTPTFWYTLTKPFQRLPFLCGIPP